MSVVLKVAGKILSTVFPWCRYIRISFSQEGEDLILHSFMEDLPATYKGFFVDVGAHHPFRFSNTYFFYRRGWKGINIDATPGSMKPFKKFRRRDINLEIGIGSTPSSMTFYCFNEPALNTFDEQVARSRDGKDGYRITGSVQVQVDTLETILDRHLPKGSKVDFLSIDVEGLDHVVLQSNNWQKYQPLFILVESPIDGEVTSATAGYLKQQGYQFVARSQRTMLFKLLPR